MTGLGGGGREGESRNGRSFCSGVLFVPIVITTRFKVVDMIGRSLKQWFREENYLRDEAWFQT